MVTTNNNVMSSLPHQLKENLATRKEWDYNIFELEKLSQKRYCSFVEDALKTLNKTLFVSIFVKISKIS